MAAVESTIVATAMPTIVADLGGFNLFTWVFTVYLLTQAVSIPVYGRLADLYGRKRMFFVGAGLFLVGSTLCGLPPTWCSLCCSALLQGIRRRRRAAGGDDHPAATSTARPSAPASKALISSVFGIAAVVGPSLGAFLVEHAAWQFVFWVNLPIGAAAIGMIAAFLREDLQPRARSASIVLGSLLMAAGDGSALLLIAGAAVQPAAPGAAGPHRRRPGRLAALILHERATGADAAAGAVRRPRHRVGSVGGGLAGAMMMGVSAFLPAYVQGAMGRRRPRSPGWCWARCR